MYEYLKFSWGHIIAFLAVIAISYLTFVGTTYLTSGMFLAGAIAMVVVDLLLLIVFLGAQTLKATNRKFAGCVRWERILVFGSPLFFLLLYLPSMHFFTVIRQESEVVEHFTQAINSSKQMFSDYERYSLRRIDSYSQALDSVAAGQAVDPQLYAQCGFTQGQDSMQREIMVSTLRLQLVSENYDQIRKDATAWIDNSNKGATLFNVFLLGNIGQIQESIHGWNTQLVDNSALQLSNEALLSSHDNSGFDTCAGSLEDVDRHFDAIHKAYTQIGMPSLFFLPVALLLYLALGLPYVVQDRSPKSYYTLFGKKKDDNDDLTPGDIPSTPRDTHGENGSSNGGNDMGSFTGLD